MRIWRMMAHHERGESAARWSEERGRLAIGWGKTGDLRQAWCRSPRDISARIKQAYPTHRNRPDGAPSLWNFVHEVDVGDRVIVARDGRRLHVAEVTGDYTFASPEDSFERGDYQHQRPAVVTGENPDALWKRSGGKPAPTHNLRRTLCLLTTGPLAEGKNSTFLEGGRYDIVAVGVERNAGARRRCVEKFGATCLVCGFDFEAKYGELGAGFIHVHHLRPLATSTAEHTVDPEEDLRPLCANCHAMVHRTSPALSLEELRRRLR